MKLEELLSKVIKSPGFKVAAEKEWQQVLRRAEKVRIGRVLAYMKNILPNSISLFLLDL